MNEYRSNQKVSLISESEKKGRTISDPALEVRDGEMLFIFLTSF